MEEGVVGWKVGRMDSWMGALSMEMTQPVLISKRQEVGKNSERVGGSLS